MKGKYILFFLLILIPLVDAGSVGISPAYFNEHFEPGLKKTFIFTTFNSNPEEGIGIILEGELKEYAVLSENYIQGSGQFELTLTLPEKIEKPGTSTLFIKVFESKNLSKEEMVGIGGVAAIKAPINILVPFPGKYIESTFTINNVNEGEDTSYELEIKNLGTENITIQTLIEVFKNNEPGKIILTENFEETPLQSTHILNIVNSLNTSQLEPGNYYATATIDYGKKVILNDTFRIGKFLVDIVDYNYQFERGRINQFDIEIENKWNTQINQIFATVTITDEGKVVADFKTVSVGTSAWERKNITGFFDATGLESKRHLANIKLFYENTSSNKLVAIYIRDPPAKNIYDSYIIIGASVVAAIMLAGLIFLIIKIIKLKRLVRKNGKKTSK